MKIVFPDPNIFLYIHASAADAAAINPKGIETILANGLIIIYINGNPVFDNRPSNLPKNPPDWTILEVSALQSFKSIDILLLNTFLTFVFRLVVNNNSCGKSFPLNIFKLILRAVPVLFLTPRFSFFSCVSVYHLIYCIQPLILTKKVLMLFLQVLTFFLLIVQECSKP